MRVVNAQVGMENQPCCERQRFLFNASKMALLKVFTGSGGHDGVRGQFGGKEGPLGTLQF